MQIYYYISSRLDNNTDLFYKQITILYYGDAHITSDFAIICSSYLNI